MSIVLEKVTKRYGKLVTVDRVSLEVQAGELFVLLGASGSGKSTVLRMIAGLSVARRGRHPRLGQGRHAAPAAGARRRLRVPELLDLPAHDGGAEHRVRPAHPQGRRRRRGSSAARSCSTSSASEASATATRASSPGGQRQRVALARALAYKPAVLLLDEPFGALDVKIRAQLRQSLKEIQKTLGVTTILVTHDQEEAFELGHRIGVIERGRLLEVGAPEKLYESPRSLFVATFLGAGAILVGGSRGDRVELGPLSLPIPPEVPHDEGDRVRVLVRPEQITLTDQEPASPAPTLGRGKIVEETFTGARRRLRVRLPAASGRPPGRPAASVRRRGHPPRRRPPRPRPRSAGRPLGRSGGVAHPAAADAAAARLRLRGGPRPRARARAAAARGARRRRHRRRRRARRAVAGRAPRNARAARRRGGPRAGGDPRAPRGSGRADRHRDERSPLRFRHRGRRRGRVAEGPARIAEPRRGARVANARSRCSRRAGGPASSSASSSARRSASPGKADVRAGGWLARRLGAAVTLLHVTPPGRAPQPFARAHLERGVATLRELGVPSPVLHPRGGRSPSAAFSRRCASSPPTSSSSAPAASSRARCCASAAARFWWCRRGAGRRLSVSGLSVERRTLAGACDARRSDSYGYSSRYDSAYSNTRRT